MNSSSGLILLLASALLAQAQGGFTNLNFESANLSGFVPPNTSVPISAAFPGWVGDIGGTQVQQVVYDEVSLGGSDIGITDSVGPRFESFAPLEGNYSAVLFAGGGGPATISQTGLVPAAMKSLVVEMSWFKAAPIVTLGGQTITMAPAKTYTNFTLYVGDIGALAGQTATLSFTAVLPASPGLPTMVELDNIGFSKATAPPPCFRTATATATISNGSLAGDLTITDGGCGYTILPTVWIVGGGGTGATAYARIHNGEVVEITVFPYGSGYTNPPSIYIAPPTWSQSLRLEVQATGQAVTITWPTNFTGFTLQSTTNLASPIWATNLSAPVIINGQYTVTNAVSGTQQFFRLSQ